VITPWTLLRESLADPPEPLHEIGRHQLSARKGTFTNETVMEIISVFERHPGQRRLSIQDIQKLGDGVLTTTSTAEIERRVNDLARDTCGWLLKEVNYGYKRGKGSKYLYTKNLAYIHEWKLEGERAPVILARIREAAEARERIDNEKEEEKWKAERL